MRRCGERSGFARWLVGLACLAGLSAVAQQPQPVPGDVDLAASRTYVFVGKTGLGHDHAVVGSLRAGHVTLGVPERAGSLVFDMTTFRADTLDARRVLGLPGETDADTQRQVNDNMLGPAVLDVARHPTATLDVRSSLAAPPAANGKPCYDLVGAFTLHGVTRPVALRVEAEPAGQVVRLSGGFTIRQSDFGIKPFAKFGGVVGVADELKIYGDIRLLAAVPAPAAAAPVGTLPQGVR